MATFTIKELGIETGLTGFLVVIKDGKINPKELFLKNEGLEDDLRDMVPKDADIFTTAESGIYALIVENVPIKDKERVLGNIRKLAKKYGYEVD